MRLTHRLTLLAIAIFGTVALLIGFHLHAREQLAGELDEVRESQHQVTLLVTLHVAMNRQLATAERMHPDAAPEPDAVGDLAALRTRAREILGELRASMHDEGTATEIATLARIETMQEQLEGSLDGPDAAAPPHGRAVIDQIVLQMVDDEQEQISSASTELGHERRGSLLFALALCIGLTIGIVVGIVSPLRRYVVRLISSTRRIAAGDLSTPVAVVGPGDLRELGDAIDVMRVRIGEQLDKQAVLFDRSPLPMWLYDRETLTVRKVNDAMVELHGFSREHLVGRPLSELLDEPSDQLHAEVDGIHHLGIRRHRLRNGRVAELDVTVHAVNVHGRACVLAVGVDVTQARRTESQVRQAQKMEAIGSLAGGVAHDFNNLLAAIRMNVELLGETVSADEAAQVEVRDIIDGIDRGARLTKQLLAFSKQRPMEQRPLALEATVREAHRMLSRILGEDVQLVLQLAPQVGAILADASQLEQIVMNLAVNARDAMPGGGTLTIEVRDEQVDADEASTLGITSGAYTILRATDTGCGMDAATKQRIFEPFFTTKAVGKGTGLGLATVFGIVQQCHGAIHVDSEPLAGATFTLYFPHCLAATEAEPPVRSSAVRIGLETVLVVEDDPHVRVGVLRMLRRWGYQCLEASNGDEALALLSMHRGDVELLLSDLVMPGLDGRAMATRVRTQRPDMKVIVMSGYTEHDAVKSESPVAGEVFLHKPFTAAALSSAVREALGSSSATFRATA